MSARFCLLVVVVVVVACWWLLGVRKAKAPSVANHIFLVVTKPSLARFSLVRELLSTVHKEGFRWDRYPRTKCLASWPLSVYVRVRTIDNVAEAKEEVHPTKTAQL